MRIDSALSTSPCAQNLPPEQNEENTARALEYLPIWSREFLGERKGDQFQKRKTTVGWFSSGSFQLMYSLASVSRPSPGRGIGHGPETNSNWA